MDTQNHISLIPETDNKRVFIEQTSLLYSNVAKGLAGTFVNTLIIVFVLWDTLGHLLMTIWGSINIVVGLLAALTVVLFRKDMRHKKNIVRWRTVSMVRLLISGIAFGSLAFFFSPESSQAHQTVYYFVIGGMMAGASAVYSSRREMFLIYAFPCFLPMTIRFFTYGQSEYYAMGTMGALFFLIMASSSRSTYNFVRNALSLRFKNETLARRLFHEKQQTENANQQLTQARDQLWGEMQLARKIQTVLLPKKTQIPGYEISAFTEPASEVGGDYYDVITVGEYHWLVIGDVSGHGVSAGLVMMMVQTSIQLSLKNTPDQSPSSLLESINTVITENIRRLSENKYMTMTVFAVQKEGNIVFSGLHQDILVFRAASQTVEAIPTEGMWLGVTKDMNGLVSNSCLSLFPGDTMLLYTDGVTEAWLRDTKIPGGKQEMFGQERLEALLCENGNKPCSEIKDALLSSIQNCDPTDDITIMAVKRIQ